MTEFMESNNKHLKGPEGPAHVRKVPEQSDDHDVRDNDPESCFLSIGHAKAATEQMVMSGRGGYCRFESKV